MVEVIVKNAEQFNKDQRKTKKPAEIGDVFDIKKTTAERLCKNGIVDLTEEEKITLENKLKNEEKEEKIPTTSFIEHEGTIYEQVLGGKFVKYKDGEWDFVEEIEINEITYKPHEGDELTLDEPIVLLAEKPEDYGSIKDLVIEIKTFIHKWLDVLPEYEQFGTWYVLLTYVYDTMPAINYLSALGDTGTGKSRFLDTIGRLCYKCTIASGGVTVAAVKRISNKWRGTMVIDEGDFKESDEKNELIKWFNLGFEKNKVMFSCNKEDPNRLEFYNPFCPKIISRRKQFQDQALEARCLTHTMQQTDRKDIIELVTKEFFETQAGLRNKLLKFRLDYFYKIDIESVMKIDLGDVEPRIKQATRAFIPLLATEPEALENFRGFLKEYNDNLIEERATSFDGSIITTIINMICNDETKISSKDILDRMDDPSKKTTTRSIGKRLSSLNLKCVLEKVEGKNKRVVPMTMNFLKIARRYCIEAEKLEKVKKVLEENSNVSNVCNVLIRGEKDEKDITYKKGNQAMILSYNFRGGGEGDPVVTNVTNVANKKEKKPGVSYGWRPITSGG
jgi:hypothetical protein